MQLTSPGLTWGGFAHLVETGVFIVAILSYRSDRKKVSAEDRDARDKTMTAQVRMHEENKANFEHLLEFRKIQAELNLKQNSQLAELMQQTALLQQLATTNDRRLQRLEDAADRDRN